MLLSGPQDLAEFEKLVNTLATAQALRQSSLGLNNMLIHCSPGEIPGGIVSILDLKSYAPTIFVV